MKKSRKPRKAGTAKSAKTLNGPAQPDRRKALMWLRNGAIGSVVFAGGGYLAMGSFAAHAAEHDLSRIGQGKPVVVQIHDPQCPTCTALQREARSALSTFEECDILYLVADIMTETGAAFAARHGVAHVTLMLFDAQGGLQHTLPGMRQSTELRDIFEDHHAASS